MTKRRKQPDLKKYAFIDQLKAQPFVDAIYLYGSRARGDNAQFSDIDLAIVCPRANIVQWSEIIEIIEGADTLLNIDCLRYDELVNDKLKEEIDREKQVIFQRRKK